jgi:hypothetical protein
MEESTQQAMCLDVPEAPYSDRTFRSIHKSIDVLEAVHIATEIFEAELAALLGLSVGAANIAVGAVLGLVGPLVALGAAYAAGEEKVSKEFIRRGYAWGVVTGVGGERWDLVRERLGKYSPIRNDFDPHAGVVAQRAYNIGLAAGYLCGRNLARNPRKRKFLWDSMRPRLVADLGAQWHQDVEAFGVRPSSWPELHWSDFYDHAMAVFSQLYLKDDD